MARKHEILSSPSEIGEAPQKLVPVTIPQQGTPLSQCPTNIDSTSVEGKALMVNSMSPATYDVADDVPLRFIAVKFLCYPDRSVDEETGELSEFTRSVLINDKGETVKLSSEFGVHRVAAMFALFSPEEWAAGIPLILSKRQSKRPGRKYNDIQVDTAALGDKQRSA